MIALWKELEYYKEYQKKLKAYLGEQKANERISEALHMMSLGTNDFLENYYAYPRSRSSSRYNIEQYQDFLIGIAKNFVGELYGLGARKISLGGLPPMGCLPLERTVNIFGRNDCVERYNVIAQQFNGKLEKLTVSLNKEHSGIRVVFSNPYDALMSIIKQPSSFGKPHYYTLYPYLMSFLTVYESHNLNNYYVLKEKNKNKKYLLLLIAPSA